MTALLSSLLGMTSFVVLRGFLPNASLHSFLQVVHSVSSWSELFKNFPPSFVEFPVRSTRFPPAVKGKHFLG